MNRTCRAAIVLTFAVLVSTLAGCQQVEPPPSLSTPAAPTVTPSWVPASTEPIPAPATQMLPTPEPLPVWWMIPTTSPQATLQVTESEDLPYTSEQLLDVYRPASAGDWPVVVMFHGAGDGKWFLASLAAAIAEQGAVVFVPTWHSSAPRSSGSVPRVTLGAEEAACAIRYARAHASMYGGGDNRLVVVGHSVGGLIGALMMLAGDEFHGDCLTQEGSALADAFVGLDGGYDPIPFMPEELLRAAPADCLMLSPFTHIGRTPTREGILFELFVGSYLTAQREAQAFRDALRAAGYSVVLVQIPGIDHNDMARPQPETVNAIAELLHP